MSFNDLPELPQLINLDSSDVSPGEETASFDLGPNWADLLGGDSDEEDAGGITDFLPGNEYGFLSFSGVSLQCVLAFGSVCDEVVLSMAVVR